MTLTTIAIGLTGITETIKLKKKIKSRHFVFPLQFDSIVRLNCEKLFFTSPY